MAFCYGEVLVCQEAMASAGLSRVNWGELIKDYSPLVAALIALVVPFVMHCLAKRSASAERKRLALSVAHLAHADIDALAEKSATLASKFGDTATVLDALDRGRKVELSDCTFDVPQSLTDTIGNPGFISVVPVSLLDAIRAARNHDHAIGRYFNAAGSMKTAYSGLVESLTKSASAIVGAKIILAKREVEAIIRSGG